MSVCSHLYTQTITSLSCLCLQVCQTNRDELIMYLCVYGQVTLLLVGEVVSCHDSRQAEAQLQCHCAGSHCPHED